MTHGSRGATMVLVLLASLVRSAGPVAACSTVAPVLAAEVIAFMGEHGARNVAVVEHEVIAAAPALMPILGPRNTLVPTRVWGDVPEDVLARRGAGPRVPYLSLPIGDDCGAGSSLGVGQRVWRVVRIDPSRPMFPASPPWVQLSEDAIGFVGAVNDDEEGSLTARFGAPRVLGVSFWTRALATVSLIWPHVTVFLGLVALVTWIVLRRRGRPPAPTWRPSAGHEAGPA